MYWFKLLYKVVQENMLKFGVKKIKFEFKNKTQEQQVICLKYVIGMLKLVLN